MFMPARTPYPHRDAREIERMADIQRALLPTENLVVPGVNLAVHYLAFDRVGGDVYDIQEIGSGPSRTSRQRDKWSFFVGDVSGRGPATAMLMSAVLALLRHIRARTFVPIESSNT